MAGKAGKSGKGKSSKVSSKGSKETSARKGKMKGSVSGMRVLVKEWAEDVAEAGYGKVVNNMLELSFVEALYLVKRERLVVKEGRRNVKFEELYERFLSMDPRLHERYLVYADLRERGYLVKTGFKYGCDFRVYERGVRLKKGPKTQREHTKWIVFAVPEEYTISFPEMSRAVRLAHNIRARMLWAVVDNESDITYYQVLRMKP